MKSVSGKQLCRILEKKGWTHVRTNGSHHKYEKSGKSPIVVPVHGSRSLKLGTQKAIMKAAGLTEDDL